ncbi:unnamed protein product [Polarella glacialis]|uniref:ABM domain-containing protein n=1 Tax=Polarella glacialis TaxID=89957 RepID=A0A813FAN2_POLGL|nr:unnamed protein product [Polarella glacialis]
MSASDMHAYAHSPQPPPQNYTLPLPNLMTVAGTSTEHRWYSFPGMTRDECLVFKTFDSDGPQPGNGVGVHSAFEDPEMSPQAAARESIEARVICFLAAQQAPCPRSQDPQGGAKWQMGAEEQSARPPMENVQRLLFYKWLQENEWAGAVGLTAKFTISNEKLPTYLDIMRENIAETRKEAGMLQYDLVPDYSPDASAPGVSVYWLLERFRSRADLLHHVQSAHYKRCQERFLSDMGGHPLVQIGLYKIDPVEP